MTGHAQFMEPIRYRFRVVTILPPAGVPGDTFIFNDVTNNTFTLVIWNPVTNTWTGVGGPGVGDYDTDVSGPITFTRFDNPGQFAPVYSPKFTLAFNAVGQPVFSSLGPTSTNDWAQFVGVRLRQGLYPTGVNNRIDIEARFIAVDIGDAASIPPDANTKPRVGCMTCLSDGTWQIYGATNDGVITNVEYVMSGLIRDLESRTNLAVGNTGTSSGNMVTGANTFGVRFQIENLLSAGVNRYMINNATATYDHNGLGYVALGGALALTLIYGKLMDIGFGARLVFGMADTGANTVRAGLTATLSSVTIHSGRLASL